jgi:hypothetical protein
LGNTPFKGGVAALAAGANFNKIGCASRRPPLLLHELDEILNAIGHFVIWQALHENPSVGFCTQPVIEHSEDSAICRRSDQTPKSLLEP